MPPATKPLSPAELAKLEHAFATDPGSQAYHALAEAYLGLGRFMEAMVVCKKGVKAHPTLAEPRLLLARVYADQGKDKKAIEELGAALQVAPLDKRSLRMLGLLQLKGGEVEPGKASLLKAYEADPFDAETQELMQRHGVEVPKAPVIEAPPPPPVLLPVAPPPAAAKPSAPSAPTPRPSGPRDAPQSAPRRAPPVSSASGTRVEPPRPVRKSRPEAYTTADSAEFETSAPRRSKASRALFILLAVAVPLAAGGYYGFGQYKGKQVRDANRLLRDATEKMKSDTYAAYQGAIRDAEGALSLDASGDTNRNARGLLAYGYTVRWGEHQHDDANREAAEKNLKAGLELKEASSWLYAADALLDAYQGKGEQGLKKIDDRIKAAEGEKKQVSLYYLTRGLLQLNAGALEDSKESLELAQGISPDDPRIFVALGTLHRRRGADLQALQAFNNALKYSRNAHPDALLGTASLILDQENPAKGYVTAARYLKTLLEMEPPPSPRQLAQAHFVRALLVSRVSSEAPLYKDEAFKKELYEGTTVSTDKDKAAKDVQAEENQGLTLDRNNPELLLIRARRLASEGHLDEAAAELKKAIDLNRSAAHYHVELAKVLMRKEGGDAKAEEALKTALSMVQNSPKLLSMLGQVQYRQKKLAEAMATLERATNDEKQRNPEARFLLGKLARDEKKDLERAARLLDKAAQEYFSDPPQAAVAYDELAQTLELRAKDGDKDKARATYEKSLNADKEYALAYCHYAKLLARDGKDREKLKAIATEGLKLDPQGACAGELQRLKEG
jgi:Tfp pilus assembly protein PilF